MAVVASGKGGLMVRVDPAISDQLVAPTFARTTPGSRRRSIRTLGIRTATGYWSGGSSAGVSR